MIKDIKYGGFSAAPSDYSSPDGDLAQSVNIICEDGALKPLLPPSEVMNFGREPLRVMFIHKTTAFTHYIVYHEATAKFYWCLPGGSPNNLDEGVFKGVTSVNAVGNTLLVFSKTGINFFLWRADDDKYLNLGNRIPNIELSMGLVGHPRYYSVHDDSEDLFEVTFAENIKESEISNDLSDDNKTTITEQVMAKVNKFIANETTNKGRFCFPFFVRYALRLYDGSLIGHSAPILMNPSTTAAPIVMWKYLTTTDGSNDSAIAQNPSDSRKYNSAHMDIMLVAATLDYQIHQNTDCDKLSLWSDIIKSIDVFISKPIYTYDQSGYVTNLYKETHDSYFIGRVHVKSDEDDEDEKEVSPRTNVDGEDVFTKEYAEWSYSNIIATYTGISAGQRTVCLPEYDADKQRELLANCATFYKLCSLDPNDILSNKGERTDIEVGTEYLQSLVARETMTDDYLTHEQLFAAHSYAYNNRLNLSGVVRSLFDGFSPAAQFAYVSGFMTVTTEEGTTDHDGGKDGGTTVAPGTRTITMVDDTIARDYGVDKGFSVKVYIKENGMTYCVTSGINSDTLRMASVVAPVTDSKSKRVGMQWGCYFFYPNTNAYKMELTNSNGDKFFIDLEAHDFLNGAYAVLDYGSTREDNSDTFSPPIETDRYLVTDSYPDGIKNGVTVLNKIYTSEVNNPFYFPVTGINTVGTGSIIGICTAAKALSQGQFGQFPLYAFSDEGVWALEVSSTGGYSAKQPITRDVVLGSGESITQIDSAVLFATDRGIMLLSGSQAQCISDVIDNPLPISVASLPSGKELLSLASISEDTTTIYPFKTFITNCRMIYDYVNQHIIVFNPNYAYAYVYSLKSKYWGMISSNFASVVNSYPEALAMDSSGRLLDCSNPAQTQVKGLYITRPIKLETPDVLKTMNTVIQRGYFQKGHIASALYGSRDLAAWQLVWSSKDHYLRGFRGTPYKYFRIVGVANLSLGESVFGASLQFNARLADQPR